MSFHSRNPTRNPLLLVILLGAILLPLTLQNPLTGLMAAALAVLGIATRTDLIRGGLYVIVALVPLEVLGQMGQTDFLNVTVTKLVFPIALAALFLNHIWRNRPFVLNAPMGWAFLFGLTLLLSFFVNERTHYALTSLRRYLSALAFFFFALNALRDRKDVWNLIRVMICTCAFSACVGLAGKLTGILPSALRVVWVGSDRLIGLATVNPNTYASQLSVALWFCLCLLMWEKRHRNLLLLWFLILTFILAIVMTYSRAVALCLALSGLHFAIKFGLTRVGGRFLVAGMFTGLCLLPLIPKDYGERLQSLISEEAHTDTSLQRRMSYHVIGVNLVQQSPLLGVGPGNFQREYMSEDYRFQADTFEGARLLHNLYLSIAAQLGIPALLIFLLLCGSSYATLQRLQRRGDNEEVRRMAIMLELGLVSFLLNSLFLPHEYQKYMWLLLAVPPALEWTLRQPARTDVDTDPSH